MRQRGVTLIELMVVVAILGILAAMGLAAYQRIGSHTAPQNAAYDLQSALSRARALAVDRNIDVWFIVYPEVDATGAALGGGAYFIVEDRGGVFGLTTGVPGGVRYNSFDPADYARFTGTNPAIDPGATGNAAHPISHQEWMDHYPRQNARFGIGQARFGPPFATNATDGLNAVANRDCSFCDGAGIARRGAIIFGPDGGARFVKGNGTPAAAPAGSLTTSRAAALGLIDREPTTLRSYAFAISGPTSFIGLTTN